MEMSNKHTIDYADRSSTITASKLQPLLVAPSRPFRRLPIPPTALASSQANSSFDPTLHNAGPSQIKNVQAKNTGAIEQDLIGVTQQGSNHLATRNSQQSWGHDHTCVPGSRQSEGDGVVAPLLKLPPQYLSSKTRLSKNRYLPPSSMLPHPAPSIVHETEEASILLQASKPQWSNAVTSTKSRYDEVAIDTQTSRSKRLSQLSYLSPSFSLIGLPYSPPSRSPSVEPRLQISPSKPALSIKIPVSSTDIVRNSAQCSERRHIQRSQAEMECYLAAFSSPSPTFTVSTDRSLDTLSFPKTPTAIPYSMRASRQGLPNDFFETQKMKKWEELLHKSENAPGGTLKLDGAGARARAVLIRRLTAAGKFTESKTEINSSPVGPNRNPYLPNRRTFLSPRTPMVTRSETSSVTTPVVFVFPTSVGQAKYKLRAKARCNVEYSDKAWLTFKKSDLLFTDGVLRATRNPNAPKVLMCSNENCEMGYVYADDIVMLKMD